LPGAVFSNAKEMAAKERQGRKEQIIILPGAA
jgi:hypothetical protein